MLSRLPASLISRTSRGITSTSTSSSSSCILNLNFAPSISRNFHSTRSNLNQDANPQFPQSTTPIPTASELKTSATRVAEQTMKRFWKQVSLTKHQATEKFPVPHYTIDLDKRSLRTPDFNVLRVGADRPLLAALIANEWQEQKSILKPHTLPLTSLVARAIDGLSTPELRSKVCDDLIKYFETDTICFYEDHPEILVKLQDSHWSRITSWASSHFQIPITLFQDQLLSVTQPSESMTTLRSHISNLGPLELACFERATLATKSFLIGLALLEGQLDLEMACQATEVEVRSQMLRWGEVEDTHDVDMADLRCRLGSVVMALVKEGEK